MSRKPLEFWHRIRPIVKSAPFGAYHRILGLILLALLTLITTLSVPALSTQSVEGTSQGGSQTSSAHLLLQQGI